LKAEQWQSKRARSEENVTAVDELVLTLYRMVMPIGTPFLKEKINN